MARIKITDLPGEQKITKDEMKRIMGGLDYMTLDDQPDASYSNTMVTIISNILKNKHDTEKTAINNIR